MRLRLLNWLACPQCLNTLQCVRWESRVIYHHAEEEIITGALICSRCGVYYPIYAGVPRLLTYPTEVALVHARENATRITAELASFKLPHRPAPAGEENTLRTFSTEWKGYTWDGTKYWNTTPDNMLNCMRYILGTQAHTLRDRLVLEVGIGIGGIANGLADQEKCELVGMDLGYAVDAAFQHFGDNVRLHIVQASIFAPPFRPGCFDLVYSQGVLHHTYSTRAAFQHISNLPKANDGMLYVWVYSHDQEKATLLRRILMLIESAVRPLLSRLPTPLQTAALLPAIPFYMLYQNLYGRKQIDNGCDVSYDFNAALHAARDRLTPRFAHRHSYGEVAEWFHSCGYERLELLRDEPRPRGVPATLSINVGIRGTRAA